MTPGAQGVGGHEKLLKFKKGKFEVMDDEVPLGTEGWPRHAAHVLLD